MSTPRRAGGGGVEIFLDKTPKGTFLADFTRFEPLIVQIRSRVFFSRRAYEKGTLQKVTEMLYFTYFRGIPHPNKFNKNWRISRGRQRNQPYQVW